MILELRAALGAAGRAGAADEPPRPKPCLHWRRETGLLDRALRARVRPLAGASRPPSSRPSRARRSTGDARPLRRPRLDDDGDDDDRADHDHDAPPSEAVIAAGVTIARRRRRQADPGPGDAAVQARFDAAARRCRRAPRYSPHRAALRRRRADQARRRARARRRRGDRRAARRHVEGAQVRQRYVKRARRDAFDRRSTSTLTLQGLRDNRRGSRRTCRPRAAAARPAVAAIVAALRTHKRTPVRSCSSGSSRRGDARTTSGRSIVIQRGSNRLDLFRRHAPRAQAFGVATGQSHLPDAARPLLDRRQVAATRGGTRRTPPGRRARSRPARPGQPARHALDGPLRAGRRHPRHARRLPRSATRPRTAASACTSRDAEWLFNHVDIGTTVYIVSA